MPGDPYCEGLARSTPPLLPLCPSVRLARGKTAPTGAPLVAGCKKALDRAYRVAGYLRAGQTVRNAPWIPGIDDPEHKRKATERAKLGFIAVSGEDDLPHRPV